MEEENWLCRRASIYKSQTLTGGSDLSLSGEAVMMQDGGLERRRQWGAGVHRALSLASHQMPLSPPQTLSAVIFPGVLDGILSGHKYLFEKIWLASCPPLL